MADKTLDTASPPAGGGSGKGARGRFVKGNHAGKSRKGIPNKVTTEVKAFAKQLLESDEYRENAKGRILAGEAPHLETLLHHYAYGKPADTVKWSGDRPPFLLVLGPRRDPLADPIEEAMLPRALLPPQGG